MRTSLFFCFLLLSLWVKAVETPVTPGTFLNAYNSAENGDILLLEDGDYTNDLKFPSGKTITLKAAEGSSPVLKGIRITEQSDQTIAGGGLIFDGVNIDLNKSDNKPYFIHLGVKDITEITFRNLHFKNAKRGIINTTTIDDKNTINKIEFDNCIVEEGAIEWNFIYTQHGVKEVTARNSTLFNYTGESFFCVYGSKDNSGNVLNFTFENNTVYKWAKDSGRAFAKVEGNYNGASTYTFRRNIVSEPGVAGYLPKMVDIAAGTVIAEDNLIVNYGGYHGGTQTINDINMEDLEIEEIGFQDPDNGDFSILSSSPLATAATDGTHLGDPRWIKSLNNPVNLTTTVSPEGAGTTSPEKGIYEKNDWAVIRAYHNYGFRFKEWQRNGQTLSTEWEYQLQMTDNMDITAIFEPLETFTLTINKEGDGSKWGNIAVYPEPVNGVYEKGEMVTLTVIPNDASSFICWENLNEDSPRHIQIEENITVSAYFEATEFIVGWSFDPSEPRSNRPGDFYSQTDNMGIMKFYEGNGSTTNWGGNTKTFNGITYPCARRYTGINDMNNPRYFQAEFSAKGYDNVTYKDIRIRSFIAIDNEVAHKVQKMQYATNPKGPFRDLASVDMTPYYNSHWVELTGTLPELSDEEKERIYIRWIGDTESELFGASDGTEGFYLANVFVFATEEFVDDFEAPILVSTIPSENFSGASANGVIVLTFNEKIKAANNEGKVEFNGETLIPVFNNRSVTYSYQNLSYDTDYTFTLPASVISDLSGNEFAGTTINFKTIDRPQVNERLFDAVVDPNGGGDYTTVQDAIDGAPVNRTAPWLIFIKNGYYEELVRIEQDKPYIHLIGQDVDHVTLTFRIHCGSEDDPNSASRLGMSDCSTVVINAANFYAENISFENIHGVERQDGPQAHAIFTNNDRQAFYNCKFRGFQDTWKTSARKNNSDRAYFNEGWVEGAVDYIFSGGDLYVENTTLYNTRGGYITAPSHGENTKWGYVFNNCILDGAQTLLGRPWHNEPMVVFLNTIMKTLPSPEGWGRWNIEWKLAAEYNSMDGEGNPVDMSARIGTVLTPEEAAVYSYENVIVGTDEWNPRNMFEPAATPINLTLSTDNYLSWNASNFAICYIVYENDEIIGFTKETSFKVFSSDKQYRVQAVNEYGSLGKKSEIAIPGGTSIDENVMDNSKPSARVQNNELITENVNSGAIIRIYTLDGHLQKHITANSDNPVIPFNVSKGIYIVVIDGYSCKVVN